MMVKRLLILSLVLMAIGMMLSPHSFGSFGEMLIALPVLLFVGALLMCVFTGVGLILAGVFVFVLFIVAISLLPVFIPLLILALPLLIVCGIICAVFKMIFRLV